MRGRRSASQIDDDVARPAPAHLRAVGSWLHALGRNRHVGAVMSWLPQLSRRTWPEQSVQRQRSGSAEHQSDERGQV
jgi:hypothetical protein